ncbi:hypothetical protein PGT21_022678 [Puccinia graminis f. sp. tritici]|uniref:Uncharacterized protein n=1 Tax=Puccinia graminis f. sp. tritici TaxID=56615 RepID=A0A5B0QNB5_PUCGR|nr:hypothetical protein PGT21_022678 [Puccinia graminis f. sp. tritici]
MRYSAKALICAVLFFGDINQLKVAAVDMSKCRYCPSTTLWQSQPRLEACQRHTLCGTYLVPHDLCQKQVWKTSVRCLNPRCWKVEDYFDCEDDENFHTYAVCPTNGRH